MNRLWIIFLLCFSLAAGASDLPVGPLPGRLAPDFSLADLQGQTIRLSDLRGMPVMLNFWASWCGPCVREMPAMNAVYKSVLADGRLGTILAINLIDTERGGEFIAENGYEFPVLLDQRRTVTQTYLVSPIPVSFFIDSQGVIQEKHIGTMTEVQIREAFSRLGAADGAGPVATGESRILGVPKATELRHMGSLTIDGVGTFSFSPDQVETLRPEIFKPGHFSVFDALRHVAKENDLDLVYQYDASLDLFRIQSLAGKTNWWYLAYYDGGSPEKNAHRMDHFVYKDKMTIRLMQISPRELEGIQESFRLEVQRRESNKGEVIVPLIMIHTPSGSSTLHDVRVTPANLRSDVFQDGVVTAVDILLSAAAQGGLSYDLTWVEAIGSAEVKGYFLTRLNLDEASGNTGFTYGIGERMANKTWTDLLHITTDLRVITSPHYMEIRWRTVGR